MGAATSFILGMGMTVTAAYVFLAIVLAPSLITAGLDPMAVHMFILYWGMLSFIRSEEHTSELQSLMRISYAVFCLKKKKLTQERTTHNYTIQKRTVLRESYSSK